MLVLFLFVIFNVAQCAEAPVIEEDWVPTISRLRPCALSELDALWRNRADYRKRMCTFTAQDSEDFHTMRTWLANRQSSAMSGLEQKRTVLFSWVLRAMLMDHQYISVEEKARNKAENRFIPFDLSAYEYYPDGGSSLFEADLDQRYPERLLFSKRHLENVILSSEEPSMECRALTLAACKKSILYIDPLWEGVIWMSKEVMDQTLVAPRQTPHKNCPSLKEMQQALANFSDVNDPERVDLAAGYFLLLSVPCFSARCVENPEGSALMVELYHKLWSTYSEVSTTWEHMWEQCKEQKHSELNWNQHQQVHIAEYNDMDKIVGIVKGYVGKNFRPAFNLLRASHHLSIL
ncbi:MAG: hypothetical protein OXC30_02930 [Alphaproteobacteria bacterium]|nr:hypothetical protein [Alphaproteobacteria bacterium]